MSNAYPKKHFLAWMGYLLRYRYVPDELPDSDELQAEAWHAKESAFREGCRYLCCVEVVLLQEMLTLARPHSIGVIFFYLFLKTLDMLP